MNIHIRDSVVWNGSKDLHGSIIIHDGGYLEIKCRVSMPENSSIEVYAGGTLLLDKSWLHNDCHKSWKGIQVESNKKNPGLVYVRQPVKVEQTEIPFPSIPDIGEPISIKP
jgi:hypothetical protein